MKKHYEKTLFESYKNEIENLTIDSIKQKLIKFEKYCEEKLNCEELTIRLRYDQISSQYYLSYTVHVSRTFKVADVLQDYIKKIYCDFQYVVIGVQTYRIYSGKVIGTALHIHTMVSENWLKQNMPEYLENFKIIKY